MARGNATFDQQEGFLQDFTSDVVAKDFDDDIECKELDDGIEVKRWGGAIARATGNLFKSGTAGRASKLIKNANPIRWEKRALGHSPTKASIMNPKPKINYATQPRNTKLPDFSTWGKGADERQIETKGCSGSKMKKKLPKLTKKEFGVTGDDLNKAFE